MDFNKIKEAAQSYEKDMTKFLRDIVKFPGESSDEKAHIDRIAQEMKKLENKPLPAELDYTQIEGLRLEARQKLNQIKPLNLGQASRVSGVSPADIAVLMIYLEK